MRTARGRSNSPIATTEREALVDRVRAASGMRKNVVGLPPDLSATDVAAPRHLLENVRHCLRAQLANHRVAGEVHDHRVDARQGAGSVHWMVFDAKLLLV